MGLIERLLEFVLGDGPGRVRELAAVIRADPEKQAQRDALLQAQALSALSNEHAANHGRGRFDCLVDGMNRLPRPALALGTVALFVAAMAAPLWFAERMVGLALVPEPLWWLLGVVVSFYFGARHQTKGHAHHREMARILARAPKVAEQLAALDALQTQMQQSARATRVTNDPSRTKVMQDGNAALEEWEASQS